MKTIFGVWKGYLKTRFPKTCKTKQILVKILITHEILNFRDFEKKKKIITTKTLPVHVFKFSINPLE